MRASEEEAGVDDTARWLLRRRALRAAGSAAPVNAELRLSPRSEQPEPEPEPEPEPPRSTPHRVVLSPLYRGFDLDEEIHAAKAWATYVLSPSLPEPEPEPEWRGVRLPLTSAPEPEPELEPNHLELEPEPEPDFDEIMGHAPTDVRATFRQSVRHRQRSSSPVLKLSTQNPAVFVTDSQLKDEIHSRLGTKQQNDLADSFTIATGGEQGALGITHLRAVLRTIGCEQLWFVISREFPGFSRVFREFFLMFGSSSVGQHGRHAAARRASESLLDHRRTAPHREHPPPAAPRARWLRRPLHAVPALQRRWVCKPTGNLPLLVIYGTILTECLWF